MSRNLMDILTECKAERERLEKQIFKAPPRGAYTTRECPDCGSKETATEGYESVMDRETGYIDAGVRARCLTCGFDADVEDFEREACAHTEDREATDSIGE